jgi:hypothetical protein
MFRFHRWQVNNLIGFQWRSKGRRGWLRGWVLADVILGAVAGVLLLLDLSIFLAGTLPSISTQLAAMIAGIGTLALAALTGVIIVFNAGVLDATRRAAEATEAEASATHDEAKATREQAIATQEQAKATREQADQARKSIVVLQRSQELEWRPYLVIIGGLAPLQKSAGRTFRQVTLQNIGRGPALNMFYVREEQSPEGILFLKTGPSSLSPGPPIVLDAERQVSQSHPALFEAWELPHELILCQDQFGNSFCFVQGSPAPRNVPAEEAELFPPDAQPGWFIAMAEMLSPDERVSAFIPEPSPGGNFLKEINIGSMYAQCQSTFAIEAVPPDDVTPPASVDDAVDRLMMELRPDATRRVKTPGHWQVGQDVWAGWLWPGPTVVVRQALDLEDRTSTPKGGAVRLRDLVEWWKRVAGDGARLLNQEGFRRARLGLTLNTYGTISMRNIVDISLAGLPPLTRRITVEGYVPSWRHTSPLPIDPAAFPRGDLEAATRNLLEHFGYTDDPIHILVALDLVG